MAKSRLMDDMTFITTSSTFIADMSDGLSGTTYTDVFNLAKYRKVVFVLQKGAGAVGTTLITVQSCDNVTPDTPTDVAFAYKISTTLDTFAVTVEVASTGFTTTAGADQTYVMELDASQLNGTDKYVRLKMVEQAATAVDATVLTILGHPRYVKGIPTGALV